MDPIVQDLRVTYRRMTDLTRRSERARKALVARKGPHLEPVVSGDPSELVSVVSIRLTEPECCADERIAS